MILEERVEVGGRLLYCEDQEIYKVEILEKRKENSSLTFKMKVLGVSRTCRYDGPAISELIGSEISASKKIHPEFTYNGGWRFRLDLGRF
jgi:hypothetical protein